MEKFLDRIYYENFTPENEALIFGNKHCTYGELDQMVGKMAQYLIQKGIKKGDRVLLICQNNLEFVFSYLGIIRAGGTVIPLNITLTPEEIKYILKDAQAKMVVAHQKIVQAAAKKLNINLKEQLNIDLVVINESFTEEIATLTPCEGRERAEIAAFLYTSGTTGFPKGAMLTHENLIANVESLQKIGNLQPQDNMLCVLPMFHSFAWTTSVLLPLFAGSKATIHETFQPRGVVETIARENITIFCGAPSMYVVLLQVANKEALSSLRFTVSGGSALPQKILKSFEEKFAVPLVEGYGLSEASPVVTLNPLDGVRKPGSIGLPIPDVEVKLVNDDFEEVEPGEIGELAVKGPNVMQGYFNLPEENEKALIDGWLLTGDMAKQDEDGYYYIVDRKKELVVVSGFNVYPREIEEVILNNPSVKECAVLGVPDEARGEVVKAFVVLEDGKEISEKELKQYLKERLAPYKRPRIIEFRADLPKNATGKIMKRLLK
ncbi:MAG: long-chain acyl-CoA synthetase [Clostridia bacterium]|jgi:long-chain acyl-CoA synthetase|nr:AMP-dependent synthetase and ligase [Clostridiales bacterium]MDK2985182.1 long-chain acyl-CoA synthetase [Clostridia bacterium]